jgi:hypothetical protein
MNQSKVNPMKYIRHSIVFCIGILCAAYIMNLGLGIVEFIPDNIPIIGNLDEAAATLILINCMAYFGLDIRNIIDLRKIKNK